MSALHFVLCDHGKHGLAWAEREPKDMSREETIRDIKHGQLENVRQVLEVDMSVSPIMSRDVTDEIFREVAKDFIKVNAFRYPLTGNVVFRAQGAEGVIGFGPTATDAIADCLHLGAA